MEHRVWFEVGPAPEHERLVPSSVVVLGPERTGDPYEGIGAARAVIATSRINYGADQFDSAPDLVTLCRAGAGCDNIDIDAAGRRGIAVCNTPGAPTVSTAEHAAALLLAASKRIIQSGNRLRSACGDYYERHEAVELDGKTLGLAGYGRIARRVAATGRALGMKPLAYDPYLDDNAFPPSVERASSFEELLARSDALTVHIPSNPENDRLFDAAAFALMKPGAVFVNAARGRLVDHDALLEALDSGRLFGAGLDTTDPEPLDPGHPLLHRPDATITPHIASATPESRARTFEAALAQVLAVLEGKKPDHLVNPSVWNRVRARLGGDRMKQNG